MPSWSGIAAGFLIIAFGGAALIAGLATFGRSGSAPEPRQHQVHASTPAPGLPNFEFISDNARMGYIRAQLYPDLFEHLGCYCGCALPAATIPHRSLKDCFLKPSGGWESHGSACGVCGDIAAAAQEGLDAGLSHVQIRQAIDAEFAGLAPGSLSPPPPAS